MTSTNTFPVLPLRDIVVFPHMIVPLFVGREKSVRALEEVTNGDGRILLAAQHDAGVDDPGPDDIFPVGTVGSILQLLKLPDGQLRFSLRAGNAPKSRLLQSNLSSLKQKLIFYPTMKRGLRSLRL